MSRGFYGYVPSYQRFEISPWVLRTLREQLLQWMKNWIGNSSEAFDGCNLVLHARQNRIKLTSPSDSRKSEQQRKDEHNSYSTEQTLSPTKPCKIVLKEE